MPRWQLLVVVPLKFDPDQTGTVSAPASGGRSLEFQRREEALRDGVVPAISLTAHALHDTALDEQAAEALRSELRAAVARFRPGFGEQVTAVCAAEMVACNSTARAQSG